MLQRFLEISDDDYALEPRLPSLADAWEALVAAPAAALVAAHRRRRDLRRLRALPDRLLADMGLTRDEVEQAVARGTF